MATATCECFAESGDAGSKIIELLKGGREPCDDCSRRRMVAAMIAQYRSRRPRWWVVDGVVVVPIWMLERVKRELTSFS